MPREAIHFLTWPKFRYHSFWSNLLFGGAETGPDLITVGLRGWWVLWRQGCCQIPLTPVTGI
jgi:hypothetical protein